MVLFEDIASSPSDLIIMGDFNLHLDLPDDHYSTAFSTLLDTFDLKQHISTPTHNSGHILDLIITHSSTTISEIGTIDLFLSDHSTVFCHLPISSNSRPSRITKTIRKFSAINPEAFSSDVLSSVLFTKPAETLPDLIEQFQSVLSTLLDKHAPSKIISYRSSPNKPFYSAALKDEKSKRSYLESIYRKTRSSVDKANYRMQVKYYQKMLTKAKRSYYRNVISANQSRPKHLWHALNSLLGRDIPRQLPNATSPSELASSFLSFFDNKISAL
jgi:hypothetical protein